MMYTVLRETRNNISRQGDKARSVIYFQAWWIDSRTREYAKAWLTCKNMKREDFRPMLKCSSKARLKNIFFICIYDTDDSSNYENYSLFGV